MTRIDFLLAELTHERATARRHLEPLPPDQLAWRPHPRSSTAGRLASHLVDCLRWVEPVFAADELALDRSPYQPFGASSVAALMKC